VEVTSFRNEKYKFYWLAVCLDGFAKIEVELTSEAINTDFKTIVIGDFTNCIFQPFIKENWGYTNL
jgi:hypothetical protein